MLKNRHTSATKGLPESDIPIYFFREFAPESRHEKWVCPESKDFLCCFDQSDIKWVSLPYAPWGSIWRLSDPDYEVFEAWMSRLIHRAREQKIEKIIITHSPEIYTKGIPAEWLKKVGFKVATREINQHLDLSQPLGLHEMEKRKLMKSKSQLQIKKSTDWHQTYDWLKKWRSAQNIPINIEWEHFKYLTHTFPDRYDAWITLWNGSPTSMCVTVKVTSQHVYYFLPATHPEYRSMSPMVRLLHNMADHYAEVGFKWFDLGQSSIDGVKQEGLYHFKKRMGAISAEKVTYELNLTTSV